MNGVKGLTALRLLIRFVDLFRLPLNVVLYFARCFAKFPDALAKTLGKIGDLLCAEENQDEQNNKENLTGTDVSKHDRAPLSLGQVVNKFVNCEALYNGLKKLLAVGIA